MSFVEIHIFYNKNWVTLRITYLILVNTSMANIKALIKYIFNFFTIFFNNLY